MFYGCSSLVTAPEFPESGITTLAANCCDYMFYDSSITDGVIDLTNVEVADGLAKFSSTGYPIVKFGTNLKTIPSKTTFGSPSYLGSGWSMSIRYEFTDEDTPEFNTSYVVSPGGSKEHAVYVIFTDNTAIKDAARALAGSYTTVYVYHLADVNKEVEWV
jgi:hypothetical protein